MAEDGENPDTAQEVEDQITEASTPVAEVEAKADTPVKEDTFEVRINSHKVIGIGNIVAVHNEVAFYRNGETLLAINGNAHDNQTGELNTFTISPGGTLRVSAGDTTYGQGSYPMQLVGSVTLGTNLTREEFLEKVKTVVAASQYINDNKIEYVVIGGPTYEGQNSNSVATTLITAMGYQYPQNEFSGLWAPGAKRNLLPEGWTHHLTDGTFFAAMLTLDHNKVTQQVRDDNIPPFRPDTDGSYFPNLHDPNKANLVKGQSVTDTPKEVTGFTTLSDAGIKVDIDVTESFSNAADNTPPKLEQVQKLPEIIIKQPAQNQDVYAVAPDAARR